MRPHQQTALKKLADGSILSGGVGTGKTRVALAYAVQAHYDRAIVVITTAKKRDSFDWEQEALGFGITTHYETTQGPVISVDSWNNIGKYIDVENAFFIFDEQRLVGSGGWTKAFIKIAKKNKWILLSATPGDNWMDYIPVFIANGFYKNRTEFIRRHVVYSRFSKYPKVERYTEIGVLVRLRNKLLVHMPYERHTKRHTHLRYVEHDKELMKTVFEKRWNPWENEPYQDMGGVYHGMRRVSNDNAFRVADLEQLVEERKRVIVFYNFNYELDLLRELAGDLFDRDEIAVAEWNGHKHEEIPQTEKWVYLVQYTSGAEGWNCIATDTIAFFSLNYSYKIWEQAHGRIDRLNTPFGDLHYYVLMTRSMIDSYIWKALAEKRNFNEKEIKIPNALT